MKYNSISQEDGRVKKKAFKCMLILDILFRGIRFHRESLIALEIIFAQCISLFRFPRNICLSSDFYGNFKLRQWLGNSNCDY